MHQRQPKYKYYTNGSIFNFSLFTYFILLFDDANDNYLSLNPVGHATKKLHLRYAQPHPKPTSHASSAPILITTDNETYADDPPLPHLLPMMPPDTISPQTPNPPTKTDYVSQTHIHSLHDYTTNLPLIHPCKTPSLSDSLN